MLRQSEPRKTAQKLVEYDSFVGRGQVVRRLILAQEIVGSNPTAPATYCIKGDRDGFEKFVDDEYRRNASC